MNGKKVLLDSDTIFMTAKINKCDLMTLNVTNFSNIDKHVYIIQPELKR